MLHRCRTVQPHALNPPILHWSAHLVVCSDVCHAGNLSFLYLTLAFVQMLKASTPVVTMLLLFAFRLEKPTAQ